MTPFLKLLLGKGDGSLLKVVKETTDELIYSKEERAEDALKTELTSEEALYRQRTLDHEEFNTVVNAYTELVKLDVEDKKSAREREVAVVTGETSGWLNKNIMPIIASFILLATVIMFALLIFKKKTIVAVDMAVVGGIIDTFKTLSTLIIGYYFGSSSSSAIKTQLINNKEK